MAHMTGPVKMALSPVDEVRRAWSSRRPYQTVSWAIGAGLIVGGLVHLAVFAFDTRPWAGPLSWRKPATFGLSFGLTTLTLAWISGLCSTAGCSRWPPWR